MVKNAEEMAEVVKKAFYIASSGRPGPVVIDVPKDTTDPSYRVPYLYPESISLRSYNPATRGHPRQIRKAVDLLLAAKRPIIYSGGGVIQGDASEPLIALAKRLRLPVTNTLAGSVLPSTDAQFLGMLGMHGSYPANVAMPGDLILAAWVLRRPSDERSEQILPGSEGHPHRC